MEVVPPHVLAIGSLVPVQKSSPERRNQKEIVAGEERPKFLTIKQTEDAQGECARAYHLSQQRFTSTRLKNFQSSLLMRNEKDILTLIPLLKLLKSVRFTFSVSPKPCIKIS